jgi:hypothetical protein
LQIAQRWTAEFLELTMTMTISFGFTNTLQIKY